MNAHLIESSSTTSILDADASLLDPLFVDSTTRWLFDFEELSREEKLVHGNVLGRIFPEQEVLISQSNQFSGESLTISRSVEESDFGLAAAAANFTFRIERWATQSGGFGNDQKWMAGDFNGDGQDDLVNVFNDFGLASMDVHRSIGSSFSIGRWASQQGSFSNDQKWSVGDFNGDGFDDLANVFNDFNEASIDVHLSTGPSSTFNIGRWATRQGGFSNDQRWMAGDFNGDGKDDLVNVFNDSGLASMDVHRSNGSSFGVERWATQSGGFGNDQIWLVGDFNGDGRDDLANVFNDRSEVSIDVHRSTGSSFSIGRWATEQGDFRDSQKWVAGDFNGDGLDDIAKILNDRGKASMDVFLSDSSRFGVGRWATRQGSFGNDQRWMAGDFNGDGRDDLSNVFNDGGFASIDTHRSVEV